MLCMWHIIKDQKIHIFFSLFNTHKISQSNIITVCCLDSSVYKFHIYNSYGIKDVGGNVVILEEIF